MRARVLTCLAALSAAPLAAQPVEFDPSDFGKIIVAPRQSAGTGLVLEQAFGDYQNEPVLNYGEKSIARRLGMPVGRLDVLYKNGKSGYCTAFIVDTEHLVTNHHCIPGLSGDGVQAAQFVAGYLNSGQAEGAEKFQVATEALETSVQLDYSVLRVFGDPSARFGAVELANADPEPSEFLWIIGHPQGQVQHISREGCAAADPPISEGKVVHSCDTLGGNSGSPVFRVSDRKVVALHHAGDSRTGFNFAIPMTRILKDSKLLKAAAAPPPPEGEGACQVLWNAAGQFGCLGYRTFLAQCADHPLAPLARGLAEEACTDIAVTPPDTVTPPVTVTPPPDTTGQDRIAAAEALRAQAETYIAETRALVQDYPGIMDTARDGLRRAEAARAPAAAEVAELWKAFRAETALEYVRARTRTTEMDSVLPRLDEYLKVLRAVDGAEQEAMAARIAEAAGEASAWRVLAAQQIADRRARQAEIEARETLLREQYAERPAIATRCLILGAPQFSVEGIEGVATSDFDEGAAFRVCSEAVKVSDEPAVRYALARAQYELGNQSAASKVIREIADEGFVPAMYHLGTAYNSGNGVPRDYAKALKIFEETVAAGFPQGKFSLGVYYSLGRAVRVDHERAAALLVESIADGYAHPITQLSKLPNATIRAMQADLAARGLLTAGDVDGAFGPKTRGVLEQLVGTSRR